MADALLDGVQDGYAQWYADRLWQLLPGVYRALDTGPNDTGPLRELVNRIGVQAAVVRRSIDRLAANQSIETCDDWAIPYIGDLVATRLVSCLDAAAQRIDVAKTIYYRRRAGTVGLLEELAADIISRDARVVEFFRRMGRTRHQFDPPISYAIENMFDLPLDFPGQTLEVAEGLLGAYSGTPAGGFADLRNNYAASNTGSAFDEYAYTAELRAPTLTGPSLGRYNIRHLGVFLYWLQAFPIAAAAPVVSRGASVCFTFDPTGRDIPLFAPSQRSAESFGEHWVAPAEFELPIAVRETLWKTEPEELYPGAFSVGLEAGGVSAPVDVTTLLIHPGRGRFSFPGGAPVGTITSSYHFGLLSTLGAGGYGESFLTPFTRPPAPVLTLAAGLDAALGAVLGSVTVQVTDSLTAAVPAGLAVPAGATVVVRAQGGQRPVLRSTVGGAWVIAGAAAAGTGTPTVLVLEGILVQGADLILSGSFDAVYLRSMTLDPGTESVTAPGTLASAIDGLPLAATNLFIEGAVTTLSVERSITGPILTQGTGAVEQLNVTDSVIQALPFANTNGGNNNSAAGVNVDRANVPHVTPVPPAPPPNYALDFTAGAVALIRTTVLGATHTHRLSASECVLDGIAEVEDPQHGCVRFTAWATGSNLHAPYRSVRVAPRAALFITRHFGQPEYARLRPDADARVIAPQAGTILEGAQNGSEMGVYSLEKLPLKRRGLALKYEEFMPIGQLPVWIDVD